MSIGGYRHRVKIQRLTETRTAAGVERTWTDVTTVWAQVVSLGAVARLQFQQAGNPNVEWSLRFRSDPLSHHADLAYGKMRFVWDGQVIYPHGKVTNPDGVGRDYLVTGSTEEATA